MHRWIAGAAVLSALALAGCGNSESHSATHAQTPPHSAGAPHTPGCAGSQLAVSYSGTEGATGHLELHVAVRNRSSTACLLRGYPGARLLNGAGRPLPLHVARRDGFFPDTQSKPRAVALTPGASAHFGISLVTNNEYKGARVCRTAVAAMVSAPGSRADWRRVSLRAGPRIAPCGNQVVVSPIHE